MVELEPVLQYAHSAGSYCRSRHNVDCCSFDHCYLHIVFDFDGFAADIQRVDEVYDMLVYLQYRFVSYEPVYLSDTVIYQNRFEKYCMDCVGVGYDETANSCSGTYAARTAVALVFLMAGKMGLFGKIQDLVNYCCNPY